MANFYASYPPLPGSGSVGVTSLNGETGAVVLVAGTGITITPAGQNITIASTDLAAAITSINSDPTAAQLLTVGTAGTDFAIVDAGSGSHVFNLPTASASNRGALSSADWSSFNGKQSALTFGDLTDAGTDGITVTGGTGAVIGSGTSLSQHVADATHNGYLSSVDWSSFSGKQAAGNYITALTGDGAASGPGSSALTLATVNANVGSFGDATHVSGITVNAKGLVTAAASTSIQIAESQVTNLVSDLAGKQPAGNYITALTGDVTASGPGSVAATLAATSNATLLTLSGLTTASSLASVGTITSGTWSGTTVAVNKGGTGQTTASAAFNALSPMTTGGDLIYGGSSGAGTRLANGNAGQVLTSNGTTLAPSWQPVTATAPNSQLIYYGTNGLGGSVSGETTVQCFTTAAVTNGGSDLTYAVRTTTSGDKVTVNTAGGYFISFTLYDPSAAPYCGITINGSQLSTNVSTITFAQGLVAISRSGSTNTPAQCSYIGKLSVNDVIRFQLSASAGTHSDFLSNFVITRVW